MPVPPAARRNAGVGISQDDVVEVDAGRERNRARIVIHVIALDPFVHDGVTAADDRLAVALKVVGKAQSRLEVQPSPVDAALRGTTLSRRLRFR